MTTTCRMSRANGLWIGFLGLFALLSTPSDVSSFTTFSRIQHPSTVHPNSIAAIVGQNEKNSVLRFDGLSPRQSSSQLFMADDNNQGGTGVSLVAAVLFFIFVAGSVLPFAGTYNMKGQMSIADSVTTKQDAPGKLQNAERKEFALSRSAIQEKLNSVPVFYIATQGSMGTNIYMSYEDAVAASGPSSSVKGTTLDQVMYPLVLKRGRMRMAPPPAEVEKAEAKIMEAKAESPAYRLIPSKASVKQAKEYGMELSSSDIPLFVADRLAFGGSKGPQLPLFLDKDDCVSSYNRLRSDKSSLPEQPNIRTSTLLQTVLSMERGTRPGLSQLSFYSTAGDLLQLTEMLSN